MPFSVFDDDRKAEFPLDQVHIDREFPEDGLRDRNAALRQDLEGLQFVGNRLDRRRTVEEHDTLALEMAQHCKGEIIRLRARPAQDCIGLGQASPIICCGPLLGVADHEIEFARLEDAEIDAQFVGNGIEPKDFADFRKIGVEVAVEEYPASHVPLPCRLSAIAVDAQRPN